VADPPSPPDPQAADLQGAPLEHERRIRPERSLEDIRQTLISSVQKIRAESEVAWQVLSPAQRPVIENRRRILLELSYDLLRAQEALSYALQRLTETERREEVSGEPISEADLAERRRRRLLEVRGQLDEQIVEMQGSDKEFHESRDPLILLELSYDLLRAQEALSFALQRLTETERGEEVSDERISELERWRRRLLEVREQLDEQIVEMQGWDKEFYESRDRIVDFARPNLPDRIELGPWLSANQGSARNESAVSMPDEISVVIYLDTDSETNIQRVVQTTDQLVEALGYDRPFESTIERGSFFRRSWAKLKQISASAETKEVAAKAARAIEIRVLDGEQADVDQKAAGAVSKLIDSLSDVPSACIRVGSILLVKYPGSNGSVVVTRNLSQLEIRAFERFPEIQRNPQNVLEALTFAMSEMHKDDPKQSQL
jgi:hypothetical protein